MSRPPYVRFRVRAPDPARRATAQDIVRTLAEDIAAGRLPPGARLPPVRVLEQELGLSKNTVQVAYDELVARGLLDTREREGVFVASRSPDAVPVRAAPQAPAPRLRPPTLAVEVRRAGAIQLSSVFVDPALLPRDRLAECARSILHGHGLEAFYDPQGHGPLREVIAERLRARGMADVRASNVLVTTGSQQAIDVIARTLVERRVAIESPVYWGAKLLFEGHGFATTGLPLDPFAGVDLDDWERRLAGARPALLYAITSYQNPTGYSYTSHELEALLAMSERLGFAIAEDDWGSDMLSGSEYRPMLRTLGGSNVLYINSFTKKLLPSLRVGYLVASDALMPSLLSAKRLGTLGNAWISEAIVAEFLGRGYYDTHLATVQRELDQRYTRCLELLRERMPDGVRWTTPGGGPTLWLEVPKNISLERLGARLQGCGVNIESVANAFDGPPHLHGFRISYAFLPPETLDRAIGLVSEALVAEAQAGVGGLS
ncbi:MAG TPA: PLP-dependent aminotransferase family protein [Polyangiaceae bacterium]|nr:PLP-dependent aminotransferase family protein [Polyangiaceae bacterium]